MKTIFRDGNGRRWGRENERKVRRKEKMGMGKTFERKTEKRERESQVDGKGRRRR